MVLYGCSPWADAWAEVALFAAAHPATAIATTASTLAVRMQDNAWFKMFPITDGPVEGSAIKAGYGGRKAKNTARGCASTGPKWRGVRRVTPNPSFVSISRPVSRVL